MIAAAASRWGVPVPLVKAVIAQESSFRHPTPARREPDGRVSRGLMQVLEGTARDLGLSNPKLLDDPQIGIDVGVKYLGQQLRRFPGDVWRAVSAYNAGPGGSKPSAAGTFRNQGYVDRVRGFYRQFAGAVARSGVLLPVAALVVIGLLWLASRRRARR